ncbi:hypothetical protein GCM10009677_36440 [Sphaerisporangium rubeum]
MRRDGFRRTGGGRWHESEGEPVRASGPACRGRRGRVLLLMLVLWSRHGLLQVAVGVAAVPFAVNPNVVEPPADSEPL